MISRLSGAFQAHQPRFGNQSRKTYAEIFQGVQVNPSSEVRLKQLAAAYSLQIEYMREFHHIKCRDDKHLKALHDEIVGSKPAGSAQAKMSPQQCEQWITNQFKASMATILNLSQGQANASMPNESRILQDLERMLTISRPDPLSTGHR